MEGESVDYYPSSTGNFNSILAINQADDSNQNFDYATDCDLFDAPIRYSYLQIYPFRHFDLGAEKPCDDSPINLGPSEFTVSRGNAKVQLCGQREIFEAQHVLRPRAACWDRDNCKEVKTPAAFQSENGWNCQGLAPHGQAYTNSNGEHQGACQGEGQPRIGRQNWIQMPQNKTYGELSGDDSNSVDILNPDWRSPDRHSALKVEGKAVNTADSFLVNAGLQTGVTTMRNNHLDGPVFSSFNSEEAEVGQYNDHENVSFEFECDGNSYTSLTDDSME